MNDRSTVKNATWRVKDGTVDLDGFDAEMLSAIQVAANIHYDLSGGVECVVTSGNDATHMNGSFHYENKAFDLRTWHVDPYLYAERLQADLGADFFVLVESDHIHVQQQRNAW